MTFRSLFAILALAGSVLLSPAASHEAVQDARIVGRVIDKEKKIPLSHVQIYIRSLNRGDVTNSEGEFVIDHLPAGQHDLTLSLQGYKTLHKRGIILSLNETVEINAALELDILQLENVVITATRKEDSLYDMPQLVSVVTAKEIHERNVRQTPELLRTEAGIVVQKTNQGGGSPIIRGFKANKLLFLVDGIRLNNATFRGGNIQYLNSVDSHTLERIEVVHGPASVLYGSDALGGVINVITKKPILNHRGGYGFQGSVAGGLSTADRTQATHVNLMASNSKWAFLVEGSYKAFGDIRRGEHGGESLMQRLQRDSRTSRVLNKTQAPNGYHAYTLNTKALFKLAEFQEITVGYQLDRQLGVPRYDVVEVRKDSIRKFDPQERNLVYFRYSNSRGGSFFNQATLTLSLHRQFERRLRQKFGSVVETTDRIRTWSPGFQVQFNKVAGRHHVVYGTEIYFDKVSTHSVARNTETGAVTERSPVFPNGASFLNFGLYVQDTFQVTSKWLLNIGGRFSTANLKAPFKNGFEQSVHFGTVEQSSTSLTGSLGSQLRLSENVSFVTTVAQGFRTPNLDDVSKVGPGKGSSFFDVPNPDVAPEKSLSVDGGFKIDAERLQANVLGFYNYITDLLIRKPATFNGAPFTVEDGDTLQIFRKENAAKAFTTGLVFETRLQIGGNWFLFGHLSYTYGKNVRESEPLTGIPPLNGRFGLRWRSKKVWAEINSRFAANQTRLSSEDQQDLRIPEGGTPGWYTLNFRSGLEVSNAWSLKFALTNLADRNYREHLSGFNAPGRNIILGVQLSY